MKAAVIQENNQIAGDLMRLMKLKGTNLTQLCKKHDLDYQKYYRAIHSDIMRLDFLQQFCCLIDPEIKVDIRINSVSLDLDLFYQV